MRNRRGFVIVFFIFLLLSVIIVSLFGRRNINTPTGIFEMVISPVQGVFVSMTGALGGIGTDQEVARLTKENQQLRIKQVELDKTEKEIAALRDQYKTTTIASRKLLPAQIIGRRGFLPGVSVPDAIVINKGITDGVKKGQVVIYEDVVLGKVSKSSGHISEVILLWQESSSLTVETMGTNASGILRGKGKGEMLIENVVQSEKLNIGDSVVTKGDVTSDGLGFPPDLLVGRITSVDRQQSALFQTAEVNSPVDVARIPAVFVIVEAL